MRLLIEESADNLSRVKSLLDLFQQSSINDIGTHDQRSELLRAAVVFLHSSIEEIVRNLFVDRLPKLSTEVLNELTYSKYGPTNRSKGVMLGDLLLNHSGRLVDNVIFDAINSYIDRLNINNSDQLVAQLQKIQIETQPIKPFLLEIDSLMKRRHQIVHQMDREDALDPDTRPISRIDVDSVKNWTDSVSQLHSEIIRQVKLELELEND
ncbi:hypothetical protein D3C81_1301620 [compost metagenome]